jgi:hypothetical protein
MNTRTSPQLSALITSLPPAAVAFLSLETRTCSFQIAVLCNEIALDIVAKDGAAGPARVRVWDVKRLQRFLGQAVDACNRVADPRQLEMFNEVAA